MKQKIQDEPEDSKTQIKTTYLQQDQMLCQYPQNLQESNHIGEDHYNHDNRKKDLIYVAI